MVHAIDHEKSSLIGSFDFFEGKGPRISQELNKKSKKRQASLRQHQIEGNMFF